MNMKKMKECLIDIIMKYLNHETTMKELNTFAWSLIEYFSSTNKEKLPPIEDFENEFWHAIWQIQHLSDEKHEQSGITAKTLANALDYLEKRKKIPKEYYGMRP